MHTHNCAQLRREEGREGDKFVYGSKLHMTLRTLLVSATDLSSLLLHTNTPSHTRVHTFMLTPSLTEETGRLYFIKNNTVIRHELELSDTAMNTSSSHL